MNQFLLYLLNIRNFFAKNYLVSIQALYYDKKILYFKNYLCILQIILRLLPFQLVSSCLAYYNIQVIYKLDSIYNITNVKETHILPIISKFDFVSDTSGRNFFPNIKYYNSALPLSFILDTNELNSYQYIKYKYMSKGKFYDKTIDIETYKLLSLHDLFK